MRGMFRPTRRKGHMLLVAVIAVTTLSLALSMAVQPLRTARQRMLEQELMYRGKHIADGIRRFYIKYGRFPSDLDELNDQEPRFLRKLYTDPMTEDGEWTLVYLDPTDLRGVRQLNRASRRLLETVGGDEVNQDLVQEERNSENEPERQSAFQINSRQITGIRSKSDEEGLTEFQESRIYADWLFSAIPEPESGVPGINKLIETP
ncbi:hypothetical protein [Acanthopleuribacter pedis]|uniref:Type II secretion system protein n=1 Tax=Acanthopleuribacter pedis TaxID=442870 RepID=A0A8J7U2V0_9BACT|nr:hypothetical protein [Acanthopleuribacter pedis]MBO1318119.1 hypothetical protein [Acanthopleuribacter pedis]